MYKMCGASLPYFCQKWCLAYIDQQLITLLYFCFTFDTWGNISLFTFNISAPVDGAYWILDTDYENYSIVYSCVDYIFGLVHFGELALHLFLFMVCMQLEVPTDHTWIWWAYTDNSESEVKLQQVSVWLSCLTKYPILKVIRKFFSNQNKSFRWHLGDYKKT